MAERPSTAAGSAALVLAGGAATRMGEPKHAVRLADGRAMIAHVLAALEPLGLPIHIASERDCPPDLCGLGYPVLQDEQPHEGPLAAVALALIRLEVDGLLVVCCDQPLLGPETLRRLLPVYPGDRRPAAFTPADTSDPLPFPGYYPSATLPAILAELLSGGRSPRRWLASRECRRIAAGADEAATLKSFNTRAELAAAGLLAGDDP